MIGRRGRRTGLATLGLLVTLATGCAGDVVVQHGTRADAPLPSGTLRPGAVTTPFTIGPAPAAAVLAGLRLHALAGGATPSLASLRGARATVVAFYASWCGPCASELGDLQAVAATVRARGVAVLAVDLGEDLETARSFAARHAAGLAAFGDVDSSVHRALGLVGLPTAAVLAPDGQVAVRLEGVQGRAAILAALSGLGISTQS